MIACWTSASELSEVFKRAIIFAALNCTDSKIVSFGRETRDRDAARRALAVRAAHPSLSSNIPDPVMSDVTCSARWHWINISSGALV